VTDDTSNDATSAAQSAEAFEEPPRDAIPGISRDHVAAMEATHDDAAWVIAGMHHVVLRTIGRRSGREHKVALPFWRDADGHRVVVGSFAGAPEHPAWYLNLTDRDANPELRCRVQEGEIRVEAEVLDGDDYDRTWEGLNADRPWYRDYQGRTARRIPLIRLRELAPG